MAAQILDIMAIKVDTILILCQRDHHHVDKVGRRQFLIMVHLHHVVLHHLTEGTTNIHSHHHQ